MNRIMKFYACSDSFSQAKAFPEIFFRGDFSCSSGELEFKGYISSDTYVNLIPIRKYAEYTNIKKVVINLNLLARKNTSLNLEVIGVDFHNIEHIFKNRSIELKANEKIPIYVDINMNELPKNITYIYWKLLINEQGKKVKILLDESGIFVEEEPKRIKLAIVMPTFKREKYVLTNIEKLKISGLLDKNVFILVIDNGRTLKNIIQTENLHQNIRIIENINSGGAGGFARGVIEIFEKYPDVTHILFMDDDIDLEPFVIERTLDFLSFANEGLGIGGSMLSLHKPFIMWESSAYYKVKNGISTLILNNHNLDVKHKENLSFTLKELPWTHYAWWFFCVPIKTFKELGLPYPFFFRADDMEYGFRLVKNNVNVINLPGIFVHHEDFFAKHNAFTDYLISRNELILRSLHLNTTALQEFKFFIKKILRFLFSYRYETALYTIKGYQDFLKGPEFISSIDPQDYHESLAKGVQKEKTQNIDSRFVKTFLIKRVEKYRRIKTWLHFLTLGSHLLPPFKVKCINKDKIILENDYIIQPLHSYDFHNIYGSSRILYYNEEYQVGYFTEKDIKKFFKILLKGFVVGLNLLLKYNKIKFKYREKYNDFTSLDFWRKYLRIKI